MTVVATILAAVALISSLPIIGILFTIFCGWVTAIILNLIIGAPFTNLMIILGFTNFSRSYVIIFFTIIYVIGSFFRQAPIKKTDKSE